MKKSILTVMVLLLSGIFCYAQFKVEDANYRFYDIKGKKYDPQKVEPVTGKVIEMEVFKLSETCTGFVHLLLESGNKKLRIMLAPKRYLNGRIEIMKGDEIAVTGSFLGANESFEKIIMAGSVTRKGITVRLREDSGKPLWPVIKKK